ncbi:MAG: ATP-dependent DNA helicase [Lachnospiraceae bacterium]|nr:ATP-dependent DNA helicase [Lachnospiraceae bacterium]
MNTSITVSVRDLVEFIMRSGDIDRSAGAAAELDAMQQGSAIHRRIQKEAGADYKAEVYLSHTSECTCGNNHISLTVQGRADGIITELAITHDGIADQVTIDEIKTVAGDVKSLEAPVPVHRAQALCYAYMYALDSALSEIGIQITYVRREKLDVKRFSERISFSELEAWYEDLVEQYCFWVSWQMDWVQIRNESALNFDFPFEYRSGQKAFVSGVYRTIEQGKRLFALAPTGTGKTAAALFPSVRSAGEGKADKIFYLTARTIARTVAEDTMKLFLSKGLRFKTLTITARDKVCIFDEAVCDPKVCERAKGHFDRVNEALYEIISNEEIIDMDCILRYAERYCVCPHELQLDVSNFADCVICDYNYVFDPDVALKRFFENGKAGDRFIFLIDEAHNLVERAREMYSSRLDVKSLRSYGKYLRSLGRRFEEKLVKCITELERLTGTGFYESEEDPYADPGYAADPVNRNCRVLLDEDIGRLCERVETLQEYCYTLMKGDLAPGIRDRLTDLYFELRSFTLAYERSNEKYVNYTLGDMLKIFCIDPSLELGERLMKGRSAVFFSATLLPLDYYKEMLSDTAEEDYDLYIDSPFDPSKKLVVIADDVSTVYRRRTIEEYTKIALCIKGIIRAKYGNYMIFFPSYRLMNEVYEAFCENALKAAGNGLNIIIQRPGMSEAERADFLDQFSAQSEGSSTIGFCVMGGIFAEGIDLREDRLIGAVVVGTGLPQLSPERELLKRFFDARLGAGKGFEYAYIYPGMNKVLQAGGRVIRTEKDTGIIALLDGRFTRSQYNSLFPRDWENYVRTDSEGISAAVEDFWTRNAFDIKLLE